MDNVMERTVLSVLELLDTATVSQGWRNIAAAARMATFLLDRAQRVQIGMNIPILAIPMGEYRKTLSGPKRFLVDINDVRTTVPL